MSNQIAWTKPDPVPNALHTAFTHLRAVELAPAPAHCGCPRLARRHEGEGENFPRSEMDEFMYELVARNLISGTIHLGDVRIPDIAPDLCEMRPC